MNRQSSKTILFLTFGLIVSSSAMAQVDPSIDSSPYFYAGPCSSQGSWTRAALTQTTQLKQVINNLKNNPSCNSLKASIESGLAALDQNINEIQGIDQATNDKTRRLSQLPQEISALRTFSRDSSMFKNNVAQLLMGKTVELSALSSQSVDTQTVNSTASSIGALGARTRASAESGLQLFNATMQAIQDAQANCLDSSTGPTGPAIAAGMVKILASFASSGSGGMGTQLALGVQNISQYLSRDKSYIESLRMLNDREFLSSMSCLMEVTTDGYCSTVDAQYLFKEITNSQSVRIKTYTDKHTGRTEQKMVGENKNFSEKLANGPLAGYYILSRQVPVVTAWLQKVQYGITPQLPTEAAFQTGISTNVYNHYNTLKTIEGTFNFEYKLLADLKDFSSKQTYVLQMLNDAASVMTAAPSPGSGATVNFFLKTYSPNEVYFKLIGMDVPLAVLGMGDDKNAGFGNSPFNWLQANYRGLNAFKDPDKLAQQIHDQMEILFNDATQMAIAYYNKYFIVDKTQVVNDSLLGLDVNVRDALINIDRYLESLTIRISQDSADKSMIASILDTRSRITRILNRYKALKDYSESLLAQSKNDPHFANGTDPDLNAKLLKIGEDLLQQVYTDFSVLEARTGFLSNRMATFVYEDYTISLRKRDQFGDYFEDLMLATGYDSLNNMTNMSQTAYSKVKTDLDQAMDIYKKNIDSLENVVTPVFVRNIFDLRLMASNRNISETERAELVSKYVYSMQKASIPGENSNALQRALRAKIKGAWIDLSNQEQTLLGGPSLFGKLILPFQELGQWFTGTQGKIVNSPVGDSESARGELAKLCVQSLAFANFRPFWTLCKDSQLDSPLLKQNVTDQDLKKLLNTYLSVNYMAKAYENVEPGKKNLTGDDLAKNYEARICALRDYHRRNEVARITSGMFGGGQSYKGMVDRTPQNPSNAPASTTSVSATATTAN